MSGTISSFADAAIIRIAERLAADAEELARLIETRGIEVSGPDALRQFASTIRRANGGMKNETDAISTRR